MKLLAIGTNAKTVKSDAAGQYLTAIQYLTPYTGSSRNLCPMAAIAQCHVGCLASAGRAGIFPTIPAARLRKSESFNADPVAHVDVMARDVEALIRKCDREGLLPAVRPNGTSDIAWERMRGSDGRTLMERFPAVQFYDYTKIAKRCGNTPDNYHLTWSYSGASQRYADMRPDGANWAVVFEEMPEFFLGRRVINADKHDLRFLDPTGCVAGLTPKGKAKQDTSGFVVRGRAYLRAMARAA